MAIASGDLAGVITAIGGFVTVIGGIVTNIIMTLKQNTHLRAQDATAAQHGESIEALRSELQKRGMTDTGINKVLHIDRDGS